MLRVTDAREPYPLSWNEQAKLLKELAAGVVPNSQAPIHGAGELKIAVYRTVFPTISTSFPH
jgi:hypothetical protein